MEQKIEFLLELLSKLMNILGIGLFTAIVCMLLFVLLLYMAGSILKWVAKIIEAMANLQHEITREKEVNGRLMLENPDFYYRPNSLLLPPHRFVTHYCSVLRRRSPKGLVIVIIVVMIISIIFVGIVAVSLFWSPFRDVSFGDEYFYAVKWAYRKNITTGMENGMFAPHGVCTREHAMIFIHRAAGLSESGIVSDTKDCTRGEFITYLWIVIEPSANVPNNQKLGKAVEWAIHNGITKAASPEEFSADDFCQRWHAVTFLYNARNLLQRPES